MSSVEQRFFPSIYLFWKMKQQTSLVGTIRLGNCFQKGNDNGRNYQADYVYFLLRFINLNHQYASPMHRTQNANAYFRFQTIRKNKWNGASLPRFENKTQRFSSLSLLFICKDYHTRHVFSSVKELGRSEERQQFPKMAGSIVDVRQGVRDDGN